MELMDSLFIAGAGMKAQSDRLRVVSENIANSDSTGSTPGAQPYRRKTISFHNVLDKELGVNKVETNKYGVDKSDFQKVYNPSHPAADDKGYVMMPNVNSLVEMVDMREARRGYEANVNVIEIAKSMLTQTINMLR
jgi:flagellar basal-body rod protein FlgC